MTQINFFAPTTILAILGILGGIVAGALYIIGIFGRTKEQNTKDDLKIAKDTATFVITSLEKKVSILESTVADQTKQIADLQAQMHQLIGENKILRDLLQGRDESTQRINQLGMEVMTKQVPLIVDTTSKTNANVERLARAMEKTLSQMAKKQTVTVTTQPAVNSNGAI